MIVGVTGFSGRLGSELVQLGCIPIDLNICDPYDIESVLSTLSPYPDVIINCAAYTDVDGAENKMDIHAVPINTRGVNNLRSMYEGRLVYVSTDYVFKGNRGPYNETSTPNPVNDYGFSKLGGEQVMLMHDRLGDIIVRTTGLYGGPSGRHDFVKLVRGKLRGGETLDVTDKLRGNQTYIPHLAKAILCLLQFEPSSLVSSLKQRIFGNVAVLHIGSSNVVSRYDFAKQIAEVFDLDKDLLRPVHKVGGWVAPRPVWGGLKTGLARMIGVPLFSTEDGLRELKDYEDRTNYPYL